MNTHLTSDENLLSDIEQARQEITSVGGVDVPTWLLPDRERKAGYYAAQALEVIRQESARNRKIEPVIPTNVPVLALTSYLSKEQAVVGWIKDRLTPLPITNHRCIACGDLVDLCALTAQGEPAFGISRVAANAENGYEAYHLECNK